MNSIVAFTVKAPIVEHETNVSGEENDHDDHADDWDQDPGGVCGPVSDFPPALYGAVSEYVETRLCIGHYSDIISARMDFTSIGSVWGSKIFFEKPSK